MGIIWWTLKAFCDKGYLSQTFPVQQFCCIHGPIATTTNE
jgi:hypothetical protein